MCGLFGGISGRGAPDINIIKTLGLLNQERGEDSCGISYGHTLVKGAGSEAKWGKFIQKNKIEFKSADHVVIGHVRKRTQGVANERNAHPFKIPIINKDKKDYCIVGAHNGNITNWRELCTEAGLNPLDYEVDSNAVFALIGRSFRKGNYKFFESYIGKAALIWTFSDEDAIYVFHGKSKENNSALKDSITEERPLHYWTDPKKNVTYFSSEADPLEAVATGDSIVTELPFNQIIKFSAAGMEVIAEIPRDTKSYQAYYASVNTSPIVRNIVNRDLDNGDFERGRNRPPFTMPHTFQDNKNGLIVLPGELISAQGYKPQYVGLMDIVSLEDKDENTHIEGTLQFVKSRYYKNGHLAEGIMYVDKNGKITNKRVNKKDLTVSYNENGVNVAYSKYYFCDGLLFASEKDYTKYLSIIKKGLKAEEARTLPSAKPKLAHADFIKRVVKEGVKFKSPVCTYDMSTSEVILPNGEESDKEIWNEKILFTDTRYMVHDGKLKAVIYPDKKRIVAHKETVIFSIAQSEVKTPTPTTTEKSLDIIDLFEEEPSNFGMTAAQIRALPWTSLMIDYDKCLAYSYDALTDKIRLVLSFWAIPESVYNKAGSSYYYPIQWTHIDDVITIEEFQERLNQINNDKDSYENERAEFFKEIAWYKTLNPANIANSRDMCRVTKFKGKANAELTTKNVGAEESYTEPVNEKALGRQLVAKSFIDLCQIAGKPKNSDIRDFVSKDCFIDWENCILWNPVVDHKNKTTGLVKSHRFSLKQDVNDNLPILLLNIPYVDSDCELTNEEFLDYLNIHYRDPSTTQYKEKYIEALSLRGYSLIDLNDYDRFIDELETQKEMNRYSTVEPPINGNLIIDFPNTQLDNSYLVDKVNKENQLDAENLRYLLSKELDNMLHTTSNGMKAINKFLEEHKGFSLMDAKLTDYMNVLSLVKGKIELFNKGKENKMKPISDKCAILEAVISSEIELKKLSFEYFKVKNTKIGDLITSSGNIYREDKIVSMKNDPSYRLIGSWKPIPHAGNVLFEFTINPENTTTTIHLDEIFGLSFKALEDREKIIIEILKYRTNIWKKGQEKQQVKISSML
jgi:predicted glutamine amidotransferase